MKLTVAADLIQRAYDGKLGAMEVNGLDHEGIQASMLSDGTLVIPGTNETSDWKAFNFNVGKGERNRNWHAGFLKHASVVYPFAKGANAKRVIGHSLGAASAQIVAAWLEVPGICFASPRPLRGRTRVKGEHRIMNVCRLDDAVCSLPPSFLGFRQVGKVFWLRPGEKQSEGSHQLKDYLRAMKKEASNPDLPDDWHP